jgi:hypothetical protein
LARARGEVRALNARTVAGDAAIRAAENSSLFTLADSRREVGASAITLDM